MFGASISTPKCFSSYFFADLTPLIATMWYKTMYTIKPHLFVNLLYSVLNFRDYIPCRLKPKITIQAVNQVYKLFMEDEARSYFTMFCVAQSNPIVPSSFPLIDLNAYCTVWLYLANNWTIFQYRVLDIMYHKVPRLDAKSLLISPTWKQSVVT